MICKAKRNNILDGALHYEGDVIEADAVPNDNWQGEETTEQLSDDLTVAQLKELAVARGIEVNSRMTKAELLALLN